MKNSTKSTWSLLILFCAISIFTANAQPRISSVYGVNLGDSESVVSSKISGIWKTNSKGQKYYVSKNPTLGRCSFDDVTFWFKNGELRTVNFSCFVLGEDWGEYFNPAGYNFAKSKQDVFRKKYDIMKLDLIQKYGQPYIDNGDECIWQSFDSEIRLYYEFTDTINVNNNPECTCQVAVTYKTTTGAVNY